MANVARTLSERDCISVAERGFAKSHARGGMDGASMADALQSFSEAFDFIHLPIS
jgi:hypothetical protein